MPDLTQTIGRTSSLERVFDALASRRGALIAVVAVGVASAAAMSIEGAQPGASGALRRVFDVLEAWSPFESWWYTLVLCGAVAVAVAHVASAIACLAAPGPPRVAVRASVPETISLREIERALLDLRGRVRDGPDGSLIATWGFRRDYARVFVGLAAITFCVGLAYWRHIGERGEARVVAGGSTYGFDRATPAGRVRSDLGVELSVAPVDADRARHRVSIERGATVLAAKALALGEWLSFGERAVAIAATRAVDVPARFSLELGAAKRPVSLAVGEALKTDEGTIELLGYEAKRVVRGPRGEEQTLGPALRVARTAAGRPPDVGWVFAGRSDFDARVRRSEPQIHARGYERRAEVHLRVSTPFDPRLFLATLLCLAGALFVAASRRHSRVAVERIAEAEGGGHRLRAAGEVTTEVLEDLLDRVVHAARSRTEHER